MPVAIRKEGTKYPVRALRADALRLMLAGGRADDELSILLCDNSRIQLLNTRWRQKPVPTDVLSFPMGQGILGDIAISVEMAQLQADEAGHSLDIEMRVLLVHGFLHLCGHDHHAPGVDGQMASAEAKLLAKLGISALGLVGRATGHL